MAIRRPTDQPRLFGLPRDAILVAVVIYFACCGMNVITPLLPMIQGELGLDYVTAGVLVSTFGIARLAATLPVGFLEARIGRAPLVLVGAGLLIAGSLAAAVAPSFETIVAARAMMGFGSCILLVLCLTALGDLAREGSRAKVLMLFSLANNFGIATYPMIGGLIGQSYGWRSTMLLCAALAAIAGALSFRILPRVATGARRRAAMTTAAPEERVSALRWAAIVLIFFGVVIYVSNRLGFRNAILPLIAADEMGLEPFQIATGITVSSLLALTVAIGGAIVADRWSRRGVIVVGFLAFAVGELAFLGASSYQTFLLACFILGLSDFFSASQVAALTETVPASWRGRALGVYRFFVDVGATFGPVFLATILQLGGPKTTILTMASLMVVAAGGAMLGALADRQLRLTARSDTSERQPGTARG